MKLSRVMIAAPKSGSGKTTITCGLLSAMKEMGMNPISYKCGPDYIDPMFHKKVIGVPSKNLDTFFTNQDTTISLMLEGRTSNEFALIEGVMGLYDGLGGVREEGSSYHLAKVTKTPIILVVDAKGMGKSLLALISGFLSYDSEKLIKGVILNRMSASYYNIISSTIENELGIKVLGYVPKNNDFSISSRHLGLVLPDEIEGIRKHLSDIGKQLAQTVDINNIIHIGDNSLGIDCSENKIENPNIVSPVIAVALDEAFCFYYEDNIKLLSKYGAIIKEFSPLHDTKLPEGISAIMIGGGYPENYLEKLSANKIMLEEIKKAYHKKMPIIAECGGFMYLHESIENKEGKEYCMTGIIPGKCCFQDRLVRFGYVLLKGRVAGCWFNGEEIKGHEFHYYDSTCNGQDFDAIKPTTGKTYSCIINRDNLLAGFPHIYYPSNPLIAEEIVKHAAEYELGKGK